MRILTLDIETSPAVAYTFGTRNVFITNDQIITPTRTLCWAAKWHGEKRVITGSEWADGQHEMLCRLWCLLDEADAIITYNGKSFDIPHIQRGFLEMGLTPPSPYHHIDLYMTVRSKFRFISGKLDYVVQTLDLGGKAATGGFALWAGVMTDDPKAQAKMQRYNNQDVRITESLYDEIRPWISNHPNVALYSDKAHACPQCASENLQKRGVKRTNVSTFQQWVCNDCGTWSRSGKRIGAVDLRRV